MAFANCANRFIMTFKTLAKVVLFDELGKWENRTSLVFTTRNARLYFSFLVSRKVHLLVMAMLKRAWYCTFDLSKTFFSRFSKSSFSRHGNAQASLALRI